MAAASLLSEAAADSAASLPWAAAVNRTTRQLPTVSHTKLTGFFFFFFCVGLGGLSSLGGGASKGGLGGLSSLGGGAGGLSALKGLGGIGR